MKQLNEIMEFDHVIQVHEDGSITHPHILAPELYDDTLSSDDWELLDGYSGQHGYSGPIMHPSEFIGGRMAEDILSTPGVYVALVAYADIEEEGEDNVAGWAVAKKKESTLPCGWRRYEV